MHFQIFLRFFPVKMIAFINRNIKIVQIIFLSNVYLLNRIVQNIKDAVKPTHVGNLRCCQPQHWLDQFQMLRPYFCSILGYLSILSLLIECTKLLSFGEVDSRRKHQQPCLLHCLSDCRYFGIYFEIFSLQIFLVDGLTCSTWEDN